MFFDLKLSNLSVDTGRPAISANVLRLGEEVSFEVTL
jgi:hypothetical protein